MASKIDAKALKKFVESVGDLTSEDTETSSNASQLLCEIRKIFNGTPYEDTLTAAIMVCDAVTERTRLL